MGGYSKASCFLLACFLLSSCGFAYPVAGPADDEGFHDRIPVTIYRGLITEGDGQRFLEIVAGHPDLPIDLYLGNLPGGSVEEASIIVRKIASRPGSRTIVRPHSSCRSGCTFLFLAGHERFMAPSSKLVFHGTRCVGKTLTGLIACTFMEDSTRQAISDGMRRKFPKLHALLISKNPDVFDDPETSVTVTAKEAVDIGIARIWHPTLQRS